MKKLLSILAAIGLTATTGITVIACGEKPIPLPSLVDAVAPKEVVKVTLTKTAWGAPITDQGDRDAVTTAVREAFKIANTDAVTEDAFEVVLEGVKQSDTELTVKVKATDSTTDKSGLKANEKGLQVTVELKAATLKAKKDAVAPNETVTVELSKTVAGAEITDQGDKDAVTTAVREAFKTANIDAVIADDTFDVVLDGVKQDATQLIVKVNATDSTTDKSGLNANEKGLQVNVELKAATLKAKKDAVAPNETVTVELSKTVADAPITDEGDKDAITAAVVKAFNKANADAVIADDTFDVVLDGVKQDATQLIVKVNATDSTTDKSGLNANEKGLQVNVELKAATLKAKKDAVAPKEVVKITLTKTVADAPITDETDVKAVTTAVREAFKTANTDAVIADDTFDVVLDGVKQSDTELTVKVKATDSTTDKSGLNANEKGLQVTVKLKVKATSEDEQKIVNAINSTTFSKSVSITLNNNAEAVNKDINAIFIKDRLTKEIIDLFEEDSFSLNSIMNDQGEKLSDSDLVIADPKQKDKTINTTINYNYGSFKKENTNLLIKIKEIKAVGKRKGLLEKMESELTSMGFTGNWMLYFMSIEDEINQFSFEFPKGSLEEKEIVQNIIFDEIKLVLRTDFKKYNITPEHYQPETVKVDYTDLQIDDEEGNIKISAIGKVTIYAKINNATDFSSIVTGFDYTIPAIIV